MMWQTSKETFTLPNNCANFKPELRSSEAPSETDPKGGLVQAAGEAGSLPRPGTQPVTPVAPEHPGHAPTRPPRPQGPPHARDRGINDKPTVAVRVASSRASFCSHTSSLGTCRLMTAQGNAAHQQEAFNKKRDTPWRPPCIQVTDTGPKHAAQRWGQSHIATQTQTRAVRSVLAWFVAERGRKREQRFRASQVVKTASYLCSCHLRGQRWALGILPPRT